MKRLWILQINEKQLDVTLHVQQIMAGQASFEGEWPVERYREQIKQEDTLLFWQSGKGLIAAGTCSSSAYRSSENPDFEWRMGYRITHRFSPALGREFLRSHLENTSFFKRPQGRIFEIPPEDTDALKNMLTKHSTLLIAPHTSQSLPQIQQHILKQGLSLKDRTLRQYHLALQSHSLVILTGASGNGKSWLTQAYANAVQAQYLLIPVSPHWLNPEDFLGYFNAASQKFMDTAASTFITQATQNWYAAKKTSTQPTPFHLVLDEMNLASTEHYFAPLLSLLEVRRRGQTALYKQLGKADLEIPPNLYCIGTSNTQSLPHDFSARIYDRAFVLKVVPPAPSLKQYFTQKSLPIMEDIWPALNALYPVSYRILEDIKNYLSQARIHGIPVLEALDEALDQKIFHRLPETISHQLTVTHLEALQNDLPEKFRLSQRTLQQHMISLSTPFMSEL